ncbi:XrtA system polysaccharide deacetylase [Teredinibacter purpureus]|uniref:XrtA system polysaccharide deacetylase n=1 Tax=Teredinibacter purpureus TaxID=2731756 RepID=UPI000A615FAE|nr:XrtA system polysaccharide deacetylase [Teredinibacter purpureus]
MQHAMTIDVEDYFQVGAFEKIITPADWDSMPSRVEASTDKLLQLFSDKNITATFFTLGWIAQRHPNIVKRIVAQGHELASHGTMHQRASHQTREEFKVDVSGAKQLLEDISGQAVIGYRAPSFSFTKENQWVYDVLAEEGYRYSSSVYPVVHDHYGIPDAPRSRYETGAGVDEIPLSTLPIFGKNIPISGGGYFRLYPYSLTRWAVARFAKNETQPYIFYMHPWEIDPDQPRMEGASAKSRFRHYLNLKKVEQRLSNLLDDFEWSSMASAYGYGA